MKETMQNKKTEAEKLQEGYGFIPYQRVDISNYKHLTPTEIIRKVIEIEQPIHSDELCRRVITLFWGAQKLSPKIKKNVLLMMRPPKSINRCLYDDIQYDGYFVKMKNFDQLQVRVPNEEDNYIRSVQHIPDDELGMAMMIIAKKSNGITPENLLIVTAREFGFPRAGENVISDLRKVYRKLLKIEKIVEIDGKVHVLS